LKGQTFEVLAVRNNWGGDRVSYLDATGRLRTLPVEWTDVRMPDPVVTVGDGRAWFRADLLRQLRRLIDEQVAGRAPHNVRQILCGMSSEKCAPSISAQPG
jgi:hypothetical protein